MNISIINVALVMLEDKKMRKSKINVKTIEYILFSLVWSSAILNLCNKITGYNTLTSIDTILHLFWPNISTYSNINQNLQKQFILYSEILSKSVHFWDANCNCSERF